MALWSPPFTDLASSKHIGRGWRCWVMHVPFKKINQGVIQCSNLLFHIVLRCFFFLFLSKRLVWCPRIQPELSPPPLQLPPILRCLQRFAPHTVFKSVASIWPGTSSSALRLVSCPFETTCPSARNIFEPFLWALV